METRVFITNQLKLADSAGVSSVHLSAAKSGRVDMSAALAETLEGITGIPKLTWLSSNRRTILKPELQAFFKQEREAESAFTKSQRVQA